MSFVTAQVSKEKLTGFTYLGKEIVLSKTRGRPMGGIKKKPGWYDDSKRIEVATLYACTGDIDKISELAKIPKGTILSWRKQEWFKALLNDIRDENNEKLDTKFTEIVHKSQELLADRLENGDFAFNKVGELIRKPISARDLALVGAITVDKRQVLRKEPTAITANISSGPLDKDKLQELAKQFVALTQKKDLSPEKDITDVEYQEVVADGSGDSSDQPKGDQTPAEPQESR